MNVSDLSGLAIVQILTSVLMSGAGTLTATTLNPRTDAIADRRIYIPIADSRTLVLASDGRMYTPIADNRTLVLASDGRIYEIADSERIYEVA
jgi:hypothetical protein